MAGELHDFDAKLAWAREAEVRIGDLLRAHGWWVVPTYDFSGKGDAKAPKLLAPPSCESLVLPDLQCFRDGQHRWFEVKRKTRADLFRKSGKRVTGISRRLFEHYSRVQMQTGADVCIVFVHEEEAEVRGALLRDLGRAFSHFYAGGVMGRGGMVFWNYDEIRLWHAASIGALS